jgi:hypothetical protein
MNTLEILAAELLAYDQGRDRSKQTEPGASQVLSCRAAMLLRTTGAEPSDPRLGLAALWGSAIHSTCENAAGWEQVTERKYRYRDVPATIDRFDPERETLTDLKTLKDPEAVTAIRASGPKRRHILQVQLGAAALIAEGFPVKTVELLYLPRSGGSMDDAWLWESDVDQALADEAADWLLAERGRAEQLGRPATTDDLNGLRDEAFFFCASFCEHFSTCRGRDAGPSQDDLAEVAGEFDAGKRLEAAGKAQKAEAARLLAGFTGTAGPWKVRTSPDTSAVVLDTDAIKARAEEWTFVTGEPLPVKESVRRGFVTVSKAKAAG